MKPYKCKNKACQKVLGYASARLFEVGGIVLDRRTSFRCQSCQRLHVWTPEPLTIHEVEALKAEFRAAVPSGFAPLRNT